MNEELRTKFADTAHDVWAHWMLYQFSQCEYNADGSVTIPAEKVKRWSRQMNTPFVELTEKEQASDYEQADKYLAHLG